MIQHMMVDYLLDISIYRQFRWIFRKYLPGFGVKALGLKSDGCPSEFPSSSFSFPFSEQLI